MTMTDEERMQRESSLIAAIRKQLPDFVKMCASDVEIVMLHQDAFAADHQEDEYTLLGMAIKYPRLFSFMSSGNFSLQDSLYHTTSD
jgi:hypothetical protein